MRSSTLRLVLPGSFALVFALAPLFLATGCGPQSGMGGAPVLEIQGKGLSLEDLRLEYEARNGAGTFDPLAMEKKVDFLKTIGGKEVLVRLAKEATGGLAPPFDRFARNRNDQWLLRAVETSLTHPIHRDSAGTAEIINRHFQREIRVSWIINRSDSLVNHAHELAMAGRPFEELAPEYSVHDSSAAHGGDLGWVTGLQMGPAFAPEIFMSGHGPGYIGKVHSTPRGYEFYKITDVRDLDVWSNPDLAGRLSKTVESIRGQERLQQWSDSLREANGLQIHDDLVPILGERMQAYWDSLGEHGEMAEEIARAFEPPHFLFDEKERKSPLYRLKGKEVTLEEYFESLRDVPMTVWPSGPAADLVGNQIDARVMVGLQLEEARRRKLDRTEAYAKQVVINEERSLFEQHEKLVLGPMTRPTEEEIREFYDANIDSYTQGDKIKFSYVVFPARREAQEFHDEALGQPPLWWANKLVEFRDKRPDIHRVANSPTYDLTAPIPDEVRTLVEAGRDREIPDILDPVAYPPGGWVVGRVTFRERPGLLPLERAEEGIRRILWKQKKEKKMEELMDEGSTRFGLKLFPEKLIQGS